MHRSIGKINTYIFIALCSRCVEKFNVGFFDSCEDSGPEIDPVKLALHFLG